MVLILSVSCFKGKNDSVKPEKLVVTSKKISKKNKEIIPAANQTKQYTKWIGNQNFAVVANQTSIFKKNGKNVHLVDFLHQKFTNQLQKVFAPEHGFRGKADAGEYVKNGIDSKTKLPIISLYGKNKKPTSEQLKGIKMIIFDIQDVGIRFYTYISTLHYVMEACAENNIKLLVLDRPNPNAHYVDGPLLEKKQKSFIGMHPVPLVYGMTIGEYAKMINGEKWLKNGVQCDLTVIPIKNYTHKSKYVLPVRPSPNLPNAKAINLYASLALFEGTNVSCGRGTNKQFQIFGSPYLPKEKFNYTFKPKSNFGSKHPKHEGKTCFGKNLEKTPYLKKIRLNWLLEAYHSTKNKSDFFNPFFKKLAGTAKLQKQIEQGLTEKEIKATWQKDLIKFKKIRVKYLMYP